MRPVTFTDARSNFHSHIEYSDQLLIRLLEA